MGAYIRYAGGGTWEVLIFSKKIEAPVWSSRFFEKKRLMTLLSVLGFHSLIHFWPIFPFHTPWKPGVFRRYKIAKLARNGLTVIRANDVQLVRSVFEQTDAGTRVSRPASSLKRKPWHSSSNGDELIRAVLNFLLFFYEKISHTPNHQKAQNSTKKHQKHKKY